MACKKVDEKNSGVYMILHRDSGKRYIGSSYQVPKRLAEHKKLLLKNKHHSIILQRAWNKYGEVAFDFYKIISCPSEFCIYYEQIAMDEYRVSHREFGYNVRPLAHSNKGLKQTEAQKETHRKIMRERYKDPEYRKKRNVPEPGERYGRLTIVERKEWIPGSYLWLCQCDCGNRIVRRVGTLRNGNTASCGCYNSECSSARRKALDDHGMVGSKEYLVWQGIIGRCFNKKNPKYARTGGLGIKMCKEWRKSFKVFFEDMGHRPSHHMLCRRDVGGNYNKENCFWGDQKTHGSNRANVKFVSINGDRISLNAAERLCGMDSGMISYMVRKHSMTYQQAADHFYAKMLAKRSP